MSIVHEGSNKFKLPQIMRQHEPFRARFYKVRFSFNIENLEKERVIATLYGSIVRRTCVCVCVCENFTFQEDLF